MSSTSGLQAAIDAVWWPSMAPATLSCRVDGHIDFAAWRFAPVHEGNEPGPEIAEATTSQFRASLRYFEGTLIVDLSAAGVAECCHFSS